MHNSLDMPEDNRNTGKTVLLADDPRFRPIMQLADDAEYREALSRLDDLVSELSPDERLVAEYWMIKCLLAMGDRRQARRVVDKALSRVDPNSPLKVCLELESANIVSAEKGPIAAADEIRTLLNRYAGKFFESADLYSAYIQAKTDLGNFLVNAGLYAEAIKDLEEALSLEDRPLSRYYIRFWLGLANHQLGNLSKARDSLEAAIREAESAPKAGIILFYAARIRYELALIAYKEHRFDDVLRESEAALGVGFQHPDLVRGVNRLKELVDQAS